MTQQIGTPPDEPTPWVGLAIVAAMIVIGLVSCLIGISIGEAS